MVHSGNVCSNLRMILFTAAVTRCASGEHFLAFTVERFVQKLPTSRLSLSAVASYFFFLTGSHFCYALFSCCDSVMPICSTPAMVRNAEEVGAVGHLEVAVGRVVVADQGQAVGADGHGAVLADIASAV